jgi:replication initiation protein RepC
LGATVSAEEAGGSTEATDNVRSLPKRELPLNMVMEAFPNVGWLVKGGGAVCNWRDFLAAAEVARPVLGVSPSAWEEARVAMGETQAAITIAAIYQRSEQINRAGGYLRNLTDRAKAGKFSVWPMVMALLRARLETAKASASGGGRHQPGVGRQGDTD